MTPEDITPVMFSQYRVALCNFASAAMLLYDYILTIDREMELIWKNANGVSVIFVFNRVITLGLVFAYAAQFQHYSYGSCKGASIVDVVFSLLSYMMWAVVSGLRVYALTKRSWALSVLTFVLGMAPWVPDVYIGATLSFDVISLPVGNRDLCQENTTLSQGFQRKALIICRVSSIISDLIVLFVTIYRISPRSFVYSRKMFTKRSFAQILLRDGCVYFVMLTTFNALEIILYLAAVWSIYLCTKRRLRSH
ncbi:uncharacterized protein B0H18DRAFT_1008267 [Fomitopsis serialis]|uniref:uncharacterized protein n=1 Tax=Fomitopsis serialis TaxID=139415 RepID=UPI00200897EA|nr:uncharacterized protein B0H18DRAFT_1008267 [Neoantrodia serialis]KAH9925777.1 hypothetical protein B0H18DRAFT_1008267 [Neoantrodia serialis]